MLEHLMSKQARMAMTLLAVNSKLILPVIVVILFSLVSLVIWVQRRGDKPINHDEPKQGLNASNSTRMDASTAKETRDKASPTTAFGNQVFVGNETAWIQNYRGELLLTRDGGKSWLTVGGKRTEIFEALTFTDTEHGWAVDRKGNVWKSGDSGSNWHQISLVKRKDPNEHFIGARQVHFLDDNNGWIVGVISVWRTQDGGLSWYEVDDLSFKKLGENVVGINFFGPRAGWFVCDGGTLLLTSDGGNSFRALRYYPQMGELTSLRAVHFLNEGNAWLSVSNPPIPNPENEVIFTEDGGKTWKQPLLIERLLVYDIFFVNGQRGWIAGAKLLPKAILETDIEAGALLRTQNGGKAWEPVKGAPSDEAIKLIRFTSEKEGWFVTDSSLYRTSDGGEIWTNVLSYPEIKQNNNSAKKQSYK
jgi:photosystem II stability/assembly factor-like uncharacterized protein